LAAPAGGDPEHVPSAVPAATVHEPVQQSVPVEQESPGWPQNDEAWQVPPAHRPEQHSPALPQALPSVLQVVLRAPQVPPAQLWLQHSELDPHALPSDVHEG
jgi:hypothetical protein